MEWLRRRKAKKNFKKLKEAYDLGYRHARENMQVELDSKPSADIKISLGNVIHSTLINALLFDLFHRGIVLFVLVAGGRHRSYYFIGYFCFNLTTDLQKQIFEASKREKQLMREVDLLSKQ